MENLGVRVGGGHEERLGEKRKKREEEGLKERLF